MGTNLLSWGAKKQAIVSCSTAETEYCALASIMGEFIWFMNMFKSKGYYFPPPKLYYDNISAITMAKNPVFHLRTKYIEIDVHFIRECVTSGALLLEHIASPTQLADILTKPLYSIRFASNHDKLLTSSIPP